MSAVYVLKFSDGLYSGPLGAVERIESAFYWYNLEDALLSAERYSRYDRGVKVITYMNPSYELDDNGKHPFQNELEWLDPIQKAVAFA